MSSKAVNNLFSRLERQKIAAVVTLLKQNGNPGLTKNELIKHATLEFVEQALFQVQAAKMKRQEEIRAEAEQAMSEAQAMKTKRLETEGESSGQAQSSVDSEGTVQDGGSPEVQVSEEELSDNMGDTGSGS